jgi:proteasome accessory factor B/proteasome accessory factor C
MELTQRERAALKELVEEARRARPEEPLLASLAAKLAAGGGPAFAKYVEVLETGGEADREVVERVRQAVGSGERLRIRYTARSTGETTERTVRPFNIHFYDGHEYLEAFCELRGEDRVFAVGNIETVLESETPAPA